MMLLKPIAFLANIFALV